MDFFEQQRKSRRQSHWVLASFLLSMGAIALIIHALAGAVSVLSGKSDALWALTPHSLILTGGIWLTILLGGFFRWLDVRGGGARLARRFRAEPVLDGSGTDDDQQLLDLVSEMAVASGQPVPGVWVLRHEASINAFVAGHEGDIALVLSQGSLDQLGREELQGLVGHEFGHLAHGDLPLNMRLLIVLGGLLAVDEVGRLLTGKDPGELLHPGVMVGFVLRALGSVGVIAGSVIRAAFSRRREYLADAAAVQFTRDTYGIASALDHIRSVHCEPELQTAYAGELAHMCFHMPYRTAWFGRWTRGWLATHPTTTDRIAAIEPHFQVKKRKRDSRPEHPGRPRGERTAIQRAGSAARVPETAGDVGVSDLPILEQAELSDRFRLMVSDSTAALAALCALFAGRTEDQAERYFQNIGFTYNSEFADQVRDLCCCLRPELQNRQLDVLDFIAPLLAGVRAENQHRVLVNLEKILRAEGDYSLWNHALLQLARHKVCSDFPLLSDVVDPSTANPSTAPARQGKIRPMQQMSAEIALLLSLVVESADSDEETAERDYQRILRCYTDENTPRIFSEEPGIVDRMEQAFQTLQAQPLITRQAFVEHCAEIMACDGVVEIEEHVLLQLFAASLQLEVVPEVGVSAAA